MKHYNKTQPKLINNTLHISLYPSLSPASTHAHTRTTVDTHIHTILQPLASPPLSLSLSPSPSPPPQFFLLKKNKIMHQPAIRKFLLFCLELYTTGLRPCVFCLLTTSPRIRHNYFPTAVHSAKFIHSSNAFQEKRIRKEKKKAFQAYTYA